MLGPVIISMSCSELSSNPLATNGSSKISSTTGWRPEVISIPRSATSLGGVKRSVLARSARLINTSNSAKPVAVSCNVKRSSAKRSTNFSYRCFSRDNERLLALRALSSNSFNSGVIKRSAFLSV